jgi:predicted acyl esterase
MVDGWMGDDWFHYGAFRQINLDYFTDQMTARGEGASIPREGYDDYTNFLRRSVPPAILRVTAASNNFRSGARWRANPAYDAFWQGRALDKIIAPVPLTGPDDVDSGALGSGRYVGCNPLL